MTINNKTNLSSTFMSNATINQMISDLYDIALTKTSASINIQKSDIEKAFFYIQQLKPHLTELEIKFYLENIIQESTWSEFVQECLMNSKQSKKTCLSLSDKLKGITSLSSSDCKKLLSPIQEGELYSIHTFKSIAFLNNSILFIPTLQEENFYFKVPIDAIMIDKKNIHLFLNDDYCNHLIEKLTNINLSIEERSNI